jgi:2-(1,2-epoxy-1,2-dihydrophenyl)acetyl-CoA isomerase
MGEPHLLVQIEGPIMKLTLNRPEALNAFSPEMILSMTDAMKEARANEEVRVVTLSGAGRSFSAGGDVKTMGEATPAKVYDHIGKLNECILAMKKLEKPIIAAVHGFAAGAGFNLALACDFIFAANDSKFVLSFAQVGLISDGGGLYFLPKIIGPYRSKELFFSAEPITAERAYEWGIINRIYPLDELQEQTNQFALRLANGPLKAYGMMKKIIDGSSTATLQDILEQERITQTLMVTTEDHAEGVKAFKEKRKPIFKGK